MNLCLLGCLPTSFTQAIRVFRYKARGARDEPGEKDFTTGAGGREILYSEATGRRTELMSLCI